MIPVVLPKIINYVGVFLTYDCSLQCTYCINRFGGKLRAEPPLTGKQWAKAINRLVLRSDLPVTLQGGEPSAHPDFLDTIRRIKPSLAIDILTNLQFDVQEFAREISPDRLKRQAPYASIRVSYHPQSMDLGETLQNTLFLQNRGFSIGIWGILHPAFKKDVLEAQKKAKRKGIDFRTKEFLGKYRGRLLGTYKYPRACDGQTKTTVQCRTSEFLLAPDGNAYRCHHDLYKSVHTAGSLLDSSFRMKKGFMKCGFYGQCNPCDIKIKTNRLQEFGHTSVEIRHSL